MTLSRSTPFTSRLTTPSTVRHQPNSALSVVEHAHGGVAVKTLSRGLVVVGICRLEPHVAPLAADEPTGAPEIDPGRSMGIFGLPDARKFKIRERNEREFARLTQEP